MIPLAVRVGDTAYSARLDDLQLAKSKNGSASCSFKLAEPMQRVFPAFTMVYVYDTRTGDTVWDGRLEDPGRSVDTDGAGWDMSAVGEVARTSDRNAALVYVDQALSERWLASPFSAPSANISATGDPANEDVDALLCQFNPGQPIDTLSTAAMRYFMPDGMEVGGFGYDWHAGLTTVSHEAQGGINLGGGALTRNDPFNTAGGSEVAQAGFPSTFPEGRTSLILRNVRVSGGATNVATDNNWASFSNVYVRGIIYTQTGIKMLGVGSGSAAEEDYRNPWVYAHQVVADVLGRGLVPGYDGDTAVIDTTSEHQIDQLAYPDGVSVAALLEDLIALEPDFFHQIGHRDPSTDKAPFTWRRWDTDARYQAGIGHGLSLPGADAERYNRITVRWTDKRDQAQTKTYDAGDTIAGYVVPVVDELETAGPNHTRLVREPDEPQDLADEVGSEANADRFAAKFLLDHADPPASGTVTIAGPIFDRTLGRFVQPWEIQAGYSIRLRDLADTPDDFTARDRDGKCTFHIENMTYTASENTAQLELDSAPRTDVNELAKTLKGRRRKR